MIRTKNRLLKGIAITLGTVLPAALSAGCSTEDQAPEQVSESAADLGVAVATCSTAGSSGYNTGTSALGITMTTPNVVIGVVGGFVTVNGFACVKSTGVQLTPSMVKQITITGTGAAEKVVVDNLSGSFGATILSATGGIVVNLAGGTDSFSLRGTSGADKYTAGKSGADTYFEISGDTVADIRVIGAESTAVSLSSGADTFTARGGAFTASHLIPGTTITTLAALSTPITVNGGDGDDIITGGDGNDILSGGNGNDIFKTSVGATADGDDDYIGGAGTDKMDYSGRTAALTVTMDAVAGSGQSGESDTLEADMEDLIGGTNDDTLSGNINSNHIQGGAGNDIIWGGLANGTCTADVDVLDGEAGNDTFQMTALPDCGDTLNGGIGTDTADYQLRTAALNISLDGAALDGESGEKDNVKGDIEIVIGGTAGDILVGSSANEEFHGNQGNDTISGGGGDDLLIGDSGNDILNGEAGNDTFDDGDVDALILTGSELKGAGNDVFNGGTGFDTVSYAERSAPVTVTLCMDATKLTGNSVAGGCAANDGESGETDNTVNIAHIIGGTDDDSLTGSAADDTLEGGTGIDTIHGGAGNDTIYGDAGDDLLFGDAGDDSLDGGAGDDALNGDSATGGNVADGDICISDAADTTAVAVNCDL